MKIFQHIFLAVVAVLWMFTEHSKGNTLASLNESSEIEKLVSDSKFQKEQEAIIMAGTDKDSLAAKAAIAAIRNEVQKFPVNAVFPLAVSTAINGVLDAVRLIYAVVSEANKAIDIASILVKVQAIDGATDVVKKGLNAERELVFITGVPIHDAQGFALALVGGLALPGLKNTIISIQIAGSAAFEVLEIADEIATAGIKIGGRAAEEALKSARNVISTGSQSIYKHLKDAATHALEGLQCAASQVPKEVDIVTGVIESLKTQTTTDNSAALVAIAKLSRDLKSALSVLTKKPAIDAAQVMYEGLKSTIVESADALSVAKKTFEEAAKLASQDPEAAVAAVHKGIKAAQDKILSGSAGGYLGLGAAGQIAGKATAEALVPSVIEIEYGRVTAYEEIALAERTAIVGIRGGELATAEGIATALQMCDAAGLALYQDYVDAGQIGFEVFQKVSNLNKS